MEGRPRYAAKLILGGTFASAALFAFLLSANAQRGIASSGVGTESLYYAAPSLVAGGHSLLGRGHFELDTSWDKHPTLNPKRIQATRVAATIPMSGPHSEALKYYMDKSETKRKHDTALSNLRREYHDGIESVTRKMSVAASTSAAVGSSTHVVSLVAPFDFL